MQLQLELAAAATVVIAIISGIVYLTRFITQLQSKLAFEQSQLLIRNLEEKLLDANVRYQELMDQIVNSRVTGTETLIIRIDIEKDLSSLMRVLEVERGTVYVPLRSKDSGIVSGLVFAAALPLDQHTENLRKKVYRFDSPKPGYAVAVFRNGKPSLAPDVANDPQHLDRADLASGIRIRNAVTVPLVYQGETVGVLQLMNRKDGLLPFDQGDIAKADYFGQRLAIKVAEFTRMPDHLSILGISGDRDAELASIVFVDLTKSSHLFEYLPENVAIQHINEFLEKICDVAFGYGATVDKYTGDGVFLRFNVPKPIGDPERKAMAASLEMVREFRKLKEQWGALNPIVEPIYIRIGVASGSVYQAICGHPQSQYLTLFGPPVNVAANLCELGVRERDTILIDTAIFEVVKGYTKCVPIAIDRLDKIRKFTPSAYEVNIELD